MAKPFNPEVLRAKASVFIELFRLREAHRLQAEALQASDARRARLMRHASLRADVGEAFGQPEELIPKLMRCLEACVTHLDVVYARAWLADTAGEVLTLATHTGTVSTMPTGHRQVRVGEHKVGHVAATREPHMTNELLNDARLGDPAWARAEGVTAYAGYPLIVDGALVEALEQADRQKDQFLGILSHELRTPLNALQGFGSVLEDAIAGELNELQNRYVAKILASSDAMLALVDDLLMNAVKFTPLGGRIVMTALHDGDRLRFEVADDGEGIATEEHDRIFVPFTQVDMSPTRAKGGVGLGLSIVRAIVRAIVHAHGGDVGVTSALGRGSTFWFTLPLVRSDAALSTG